MAGVSMGFITMPLKIGEPMTKTVYFFRSFLICGALVWAVFNLAACSPDNYSECTQFVEKANAEYEECDEESPIPDNQCESFRNVDANCAQFFDCLSEAYSCESDGTMSEDTSACTGCT
jgi:hypothetical protein